MTLLDRGAVLGATVTFTVDGHDPTAIRDALHKRGVNVSVMERSSAQLDYGPRGLTTAVRSSVHYYNDDTDLDRLVTGVRALA